jgi:23S rRNA pseudouridine2605 synthase
MTERLQKILAQRGIASRRHAEEMIAAGRVWVNGQVAVIGQKVDPAEDRIAVDGILLPQTAKIKHLYLLLHKPNGVVTTCHDPWGRPTVFDLLPPEYYPMGLHPVGRLDAPTTGALLLTNDGNMTYYLTHPTHHVSKVYDVWVRGNPSASILEHWRAGIELEGRFTLPAQVQVIVPYCREQNCTGLEVILREGRNRQIRRVAKALGHPVLQLHRRQIGPISLDGAGFLLQPGQWRTLTPSEIEAIQHIINIKDRTGHKESQYEHARI